MIHKIHNARFLAAGNTLQRAEDAQDIAVDPTDDFGFRAGFGACARRSLGRVVQVQRSWGVPGNLDAHSSLMVDQPRKSTSGRRQRARGGGRELRELLRRGADAMRRVCGVAGECKLMRRINKWTFLIHFSDPGTGVLGPILVHFAALW